MLHLPFGLLSPFCNDTRSSDCGPVTAPTSRDQTRIARQDPEPRRAVVIEPSLPLQRLPIRPTVKQTVTRTMGSHATAPLGKCVTMYYGVLKGSTAHTRDFTRQGRGQPIKKFYRSTGKKNDFHTSRPLNAREDWSHVDHYRSTKRSAAWFSQRTHKDRTAVCGLSTQPPLRTYGLTRHMYTGTDDDMHDSSLPLPRSSSPRSSSPPSSTTTLPPRASNGCNDDGNAVNRNGVDRHRDDGTTTTTSADSDGGHRTRSIPTSEQV